MVMPRWITWVLVVGSDYLHRSDPRRPNVTRTSRSQQLPVGIPLAMTTPLSVRVYVMTIAVLA